MAEIGTITTLFLTAAGKRLQAKVQGEKDLPLVLTRAKIGFGYLQDDMNLLGLTGLINEVPSHQTGEKGTTATVDLTRVYDDTDEGMAYVGVTVKNGDNPRFYLREFAIYALDPDAGEICYGIANLGDEAPPIAPYDGRNHIEYKYDFPTVIANANDVVANITLAADTPWEEFIQVTDKLQQSIETLENTLSDEGITGGSYHREVNKPVWNRADLSGSGMESVAVKETYFSYKLADYEKEDKKVYINSIIEDAIEHLYSDQGLRYHVFDLFVFGSVSQWDTLEDMFKNEAVVSVKGAYVSINDEGNNGINYLCGRLVYG